jgi:hypothetical protein
MTKIIGTISIFLCLIFTTGCGTKRQYFEPENLQGSIKFKGSISSNIKEVAKEGASLKNGGVITRSGNEIDINLEKGHSFLGEFDGKFVTSSPYGILFVKDREGGLLYRQNIGSIVASAAVSENTLALIASDNTLYIFDMNDNVTIFQKKMEGMYSLDSRVAVPYFLGCLVVFPTLDGKLSIVDRNSGNLIRNVVISAERDFNNVIFLDVVEDRMFATTAKRIIGISPTNINYIDEEIKDAVLLHDRIFVFTKDGRVILADLDLKILNEQKFPFAIFSAAAAKDKLYIIEKRGYLIKSDLDLKEFEIFSLPFDMKDFLFVADDKIYYGNSFYTLE